MRPLFCNLRGHCNGRRVTGFAFNPQVGILG